MDKKLYFVSSLPRSGSSLLMNILGQNPNHYVTPTSGLAEMFGGAFHTWPNITEFQSEGLEKVKPRIKNLIRGMLYGFFEEEFRQGKTVFDKSRAWTNFAEQLEDCLRHEIKIIITVRDPRAIAASFEKLFRNGEIDWRYTIGVPDQYLNEQTLLGRIQNWFSPGGVAGLAINRTRDLIVRKPSRVVVIPYNLLVSDPKEVMKDLGDTLNLSEYEYDFDNVKQITHEDDTWYGMKLHKVRPKVEKVKDDWSEIIPQNIATEMAELYKDIIEMSESDSIFVGEE